MSDGRREARIMSFDSKTSCPGLTPDIGKTRRKGGGENGFGAHGFLYKRAAM